MRVRAFTRGNVANLAWARFGIRGGDMKVRLFGVVVLLAVAVFAPSLMADETTFCNAYITTLPYTISAQGHYCLDRNLSTAMTSGAAITIAVDFVVLDLNNFKIGGGSAGAGTLTKGVYANNHSN